MPGASAKLSPRPYIRAEDLEAKIWGQIRDILARPDLLVDRYYASQDADTLTADLRDAERDVAKWQAKSDRLIGLYTSDDISRDEFDRMRKYLNEPSEAAQERLERLRQQQADLNHSDDILAAFIEASRHYLDTLDAAGRREVLTEVIDRCDAGQRQRPALLATSSQAAEGLRIDSRSRRERIRSSPAYRFLRMP